MSVTFQCPSCLETLEYEGDESAFQTCRYCKGKILVPAEAVHNAESEYGEPSDYSLAGEKDLRLAEIQRELQTGRKIQAIAMFREYFGGDLRSAKDAVEALQRGSRVDVSRSALERGYTASQENQSQAIYPKSGGGTSGKNRRAIVLGILIALGIAIFNIFFRD